VTRLRLIILALVAVMAIGGTAAIAAQKPTKLTLEVTVLKKKSAPYKIQASGRLTLPKTQYKTACTGSHVVVAVKHARKTLWKKNVNLSASCTYKITAKIKHVFHHRRKLRVYSRLARNATFLNIPAKSVLIHVQTG
jgi:hypothetical protein